MVLNQSKHQLGICLKGLRVTMKNISQGTRWPGLHFTQSRISLHQLVQFSLFIYLLKARTHRHTHKYAITEQINSTDYCLRGTQCLQSAKFTCLGFMQQRMQAVFNGSSTSFYCLIKKSSLYLTETAPLLTTNTSRFKFFQKKVT